MRWLALCSPLLFLAIPVLLSIQFNRILRSTSEHVENDR